MKDDPVKTAAEALSDLNTFAIVITGRSWKGKETLDYARNNAEPGPSGLARHRIDGRCIGHGDGTYDLIRGEFQ